MLEFVRTSGIVIPIVHKEEAFYNSIKSFLTRTMKNYQDGTFTTVKFYRENSKAMIIPRYFPIQRYVYCEINDTLPEATDIKINHRIVPKNDLQRNAIHHMLTTNNGLLQLEPGVGKTVITICAIAEKKKKAFILVHKDYLADQWRGPGTPTKPHGFLHFTDIPEDEIVRLSSATYKEDLKKSIIICTDQTFISLLKRDTANFITALKEARIGVFVGDEVHTSIGAPSFSECSLFIPANEAYGLSATPSRFDGNTDIIHFHSGPLFTDDGDTDTMPVNVNVIMFDGKCDRSTHEKIDMYLYWDGKFQRGRYLVRLRKSKIFLSIMKGLIEKVKDDRDTIIVAERLNLIDDLFLFTKSDSKSKFIGTINKKVDQNQLLESKVVFSTPGKIRDGVDIPAKDCLIMTSPVSNISQLSGRVVRQSKDKKTPIFMDLVDIGCRDIAGSLNTRLAFYEKKNWNVKFIRVHDNGSKTQLSREDAMIVLGNIK